MSQQQQPAEITYVVVRRRPATSAPAGSGETPRDPDRPAHFPLRAHIRRRRRRTPPQWARRWDFWLAFLLGAFLRLWSINSSRFLDDWKGMDQAGLMTLAREGWLYGALPVTGIPSSIQTLNSPISVYLLLPFALFGPNPLPAILSVALWNALGVALCYIFAQRYFGRLVAAIGTLLFATAGMAVNQSRFLWQQNYLPPLILLWAITLYAGCVRGKRGWLAPNVLLLAIAALLHPTALLLAPATLLGVLLAPRRPRFREYLASAAICLLLLAPTLLWELVSGGADVALLRAYLTQRSSINLSVFAKLVEILGVPASTDVGKSSLYALFGKGYLALDGLLTLLFLAGWLILTADVIAPGLRLWRSWRAAATDPSGAATTGWGRWLALARSLWLGLRADGAWRALLLLWLWVTLPIALLLRHSSTLYSHYLIPLFPAAFLLMAWAIVWLERRAPRMVSRIESRSSSRMTPRLMLLARVSALTLTLLLVTAQLGASMLYIGSVASGRFDAGVSSYGYPLDEVQQADARLSALQQSQHAGATYVVLPTPYHWRAPLQYLLVDEHAGRVGVTDDCLALPAPSSGATLVTVTHALYSPESPAEALLATLPNAAHIADIPLRGGRPFATYLVNGPTPLLPGEQSLPPATFANAAGDGLRLLAAAADQGMLRLRWQVLGATPGGLNAVSYQVQARLIPADGQAPTTAATMTCALTQVQPGQTLFTWAPLPTAAMATSSAAATAPTAGMVILAPSGALSDPGVAQAAGTSIGVTVQGSAAHPEIASFGPLRLLSARSVTTLLHLALSPTLATPR